MRRYVAGVIGTTLHHYNRSLFGFLAPMLAPFFFPTADPVWSLIYTYAILPIGLLSKPFGAFIFGHLGDKIGPQKTLCITLLGMTLATCAIGFLPTHDTIGMAAPLFLLILKLAQNFFAVGQTTGSAIFLLEQSKKEAHCLISSLFDAAGIAGTLIAAAAVLLLNTYGLSWRWLFWLSGLSGLLGFLLRINDKPQHPSAINQAQSLKILWAHKSAAFTIAAVAGFSYANYYLVMTFMTGFLPQISAISSADAIALQTQLLLFDLFLLPVFGYFGTKFGKEQLIFFAIAAIVIAVLPLFFLLRQATYLSAALVRIILTLFGVCLAAPYHAWAVEVSPFEHRYLIGGIGSAIGSRFFGAPIPALSLYLYHMTGWIVAPTFPLILVGTLALFALTRKRKQT